MNALDYLLADIRAAHLGHALPKRNACPQGQAAKLRPAKAKPAAPKAQAAPVRIAPPATEESPQVARALAVLRAAMKG